MKVELKNVSKRLNDALRGCSLAGRIYSETH